jgi:hypothetical protein
MGTSKKTTTSKVQNKNITFKNGKNAQAESLMKRAFEPLFSPKDGKARLTFCGAEHSLIEWEKKGKDHEKPVLKLVFSCLDVTHEMPVNIAVTCEYRLSEKNRLGKILSLMGFVLTDETEVIDEDDEFGVKTKQANPTEIFDFLRGQCGLVFKGSLQRPTKKDKVTGERYELKGLWEIVPDSLEPIMKNGKQLRDMLASDVSDDAFEKPEINMESEAG